MNESLVLLTPRLCTKRSPIPVTVRNWVPQENGNYPRFDLKAAYLQILYWRWFSWKWKEQLNKVGWANTSSFSSRFSLFRGLLYLQVTNRNFLVGELLGRCCLLTHIPSISFILYSEFSQQLYTCVERQALLLRWDALECLLKTSFRLFDKSFRTKMFQ